MAGRGAGTYAFNVVVFVLLVIFAAQLTSILHPPPWLYGFVFAVCLLPAVIFFKVRRPEAAVSWRETLIGLPLLGVAMTALMLSYEWVDVPMRYRGPSLLLILAVWMTLRDLWRKRAASNAGSG